MNNDLRRKKNRCVYSTIGRDLGGTKIMSNICVEFFSPHNFSAVENIESSICLFRLNKI